MGVWELTTIEARGTARYGGTIYIYRTSVNREARGVEIYSGSYCTSPHHRVLVRVHYGREGSGVNKSRVYPVLGWSFSLLFFRFTLAGYESCIQIYAVNLLIHLEYAPVSVYISCPSPLLPRACFGAGVLGEWEDDSVLGLLVCFAFWNLSFGESMMRV